MSDAPLDFSELFSLLGLARRAGELLIGQDKVFVAVKKTKLLIFISDDCSESVERKAAAAVERKEAEVKKLKKTDRTVLGSHLGVKNAQIAALPYGGGFAEKALRLYYGSGANE